MKNTLLLSSTDNFFKCSYSSMSWLLEQIGRLSSTASVSRVFSLLFLLSGCFSFFPLKLSIACHENIGSLTNFFSWSTSFIRSLRFGSHSCFLRLLYAILFHLSIKALGSLETNIHITSGVHGPDSHVGSHIDNYIGPKKYF